MTTLETALRRPAARSSASRPSLALAVLTAGLLLCAAGYMAVTVLLVRFAASLLA